MGFGEPVPQAPGDSPDFWGLWEGVVRRAHPAPIDLLFAGEPYGAELARRVGGRFVGLGGRIMAADAAGVGGVSATAIRADPWGHWRWLPPPVRTFYSRTICLHGVESTGKTMLAERLARHFETVSVAEYGRVHCEIYGTNCTRQDLLLIGRAQQAMIEAAKPWCNRRLISDTDSLMTAAWSRMMIGDVLAELLQQSKADLYLLLEPDVPWLDDGTRIYGGAEREHFHAIARGVLEQADVRFETLSGTWDERFVEAVRLVEAAPPPAASN
jgi:NadR type nicotinamide-nucleotide adenylyltransferase